MRNFFKSRRFHRGNIFSPLPLCGLVLALPYSPYLSNAIPSPAIVRKSQQVPMLGQDTLNSTTKSRVAHNDPICA